MLNKTRNIFIVGIKGAAMSNLAVMLKQLGHRVSGCDVEEEFITDDILRRYKIPVSVGFNTSQLGTKIDLITYSAAHNGQDNPIVKEGVKRGIIVLSQAVLLSEIMDLFPIRIAVCGCHGKTTTTSLLTFALKNLEAAPSHMIGAPFFNEIPGGAIDGKKYIVVEADEYGIDPPRNKKAKFLELNPTHTLCTNIDYDHPDVYASIEETKKTFLSFFRQGKLYLCADDPNINSLIPHLTQPIKTFGFSKDASLHVTTYASGETKTTFNVTYDRHNLGEFVISLFGEKNISNAAGVILILLDLGFSVDLIKKAIVGFIGVKRRSELLHSANDILLIDDYGHHPSEIAATISSLRSRFPHKRIIVLFQPHTFSRTEILKHDFAVSLSRADIVLVAPIFASARENSDKTSVSSKSIEQEAVGIGNNNVIGYASKADVLVKLQSIIKRNDVVLTLGAGDIYKLKDDIIKIIQRATCKV
ncbi:UDP-N-acetylmuramate--L-alanine ligase [Candidatus Roizmanbacteria bacterium CG_4_10_14_0_8_um_filter_39_9]|uniref:UDP-N-acetylmuramate--L-alanine ligase n=1 Tax=Candidatus Roizmanbacteria bacterium CG_4_10_14_0_8_um_filter_39_9 TaxID=1974829 RepID=A0A2M7QCH8_9BACT|nr:MAG: UDP-N-acetylmuramate--L-alanine ligase [Candidatus Roizmanbacteria bacterium CG_4_10_14_0_8_um_filter_39_9]